MQTIRLKQFIRKHKKIVLFLSVISLIFLIFAVYLIIGILNTMSSVKKLNMHTAQIKTAQNTKDFSKILVGIKSFESDISNLHANLNYFFPFKFLPIAGNYYMNGEHLLSAASSIDGGALIVATSASPIADSLGYGSHPIQGPAKIAAFVHALPELSKGITNAKQYFDNANSDLSKVDPNYLPDYTIKGINLKKSFPEINKQFNSFVKFIPQVNQIAPVLQTALGDPTPQNYLMLFQNDKEIRPDGGFISVYGFLNFKNGTLGDIKTTDIYNLDNYITNSPPAPIQLTQYNATNVWYLRDANLSPDIPTSSATIERMYRSAHTSVLPPINGVVYIDTQFVASLLDAVGPVTVPEYNQTVTSKDFAYLLEYYSERVDSGKKIRKGFVNLLLPQIKAKIFSAQKDQLLNLITIGMKDFNEKHIFTYADNPVVEETINKYNWGGTFPTPDANDFFSMSEANLGGAKADFYIKRTISQSIEKTAKGFEKTVHIKFTNNQVYDNWLNGPYKAWVRFYVPKGSELISMVGDDGSSYGGIDGTLRKYNDLGYSVFDNHIRVPVKYAKADSATHLDITLKYRLPDSFSIANSYNLLIVKQPGVEDMNISATYNGKSITKDIFTDIKISL